LNKLKWKLQSVQRHYEVLSIDGSNSVDVDDVTVVDDIDDEDDDTDTDRDTDDGIVDDDDDDDDDDSTVVVVVVVDDVVDVTIATVSRAINRCSTRRNRSIKCDITGLPVPVGVSELVSQSIMLPLFNEQN
jgi:hypothetical protein